jgi:hypothetical protein
MNAELVGILKALIVEAGLALIVASYFFERGERLERAFQTLFMVLATLSAFAYTNFGQFHYRAGIVHTHEQYHFFFGSKYLEELRYDALYDASIVALAEEDARAARRIVPRDPMTFEMAPNPLGTPRADEVRARFDDTRWEAFREEVRFFVKDRQLGARVLTDHGNTGSPTWAMVASLFTRTIPLSDSGMNAYALLDMALMAAFFASVFWAFGARTGYLTMIVGLCVPIVHDWLGGSILRMDWIFALGMAWCCFGRKKHALAGAFIGYAVATKLLAGLMVLPLGLAMLAYAVKARRLPREHVVVVGTAIVTALVFVGMSAAYFGGFQIWKDYDARMLVTLHEHYYSNQHSFRDIFLQALHIGSLRDLGWSPQPVAASLPEVRIEDYAVAFGLAQAALVLAIGWVASRHPLERAIAFGPLVVYAMLVTNLYYWQILLFCALGFAQGYRQSARACGYLVAVFAFELASLVFERGRSLGHLGYFGSYRLIWLLIALFAVELAHTERGARVWARIKAWLAEGPEGDEPLEAKGQKKKRRKKKASGASSPA